ncbi:hypothetical protein QBC45DRAFT_445053 [Copromyces sp. CBS 386.78]|nr:hypothetical protein QBC45DRAFT_445053 [Copromyces sp. CBS 386.78]
MSAATTTQAGGGFSLFPNTNVTPRPPSRPSRAATPQGRPSTATEPSSSREAGRQSPIGGRGIPREGKQRSASHSNNHSNNPWQSALDSARQQREHREQHHEQPQRQPPVESMPSDPIVETSVAAPISEADAPPRCETTLSEAETLVGQQSRGTRSSIPQPPITYAPGPSNAAAMAAPPAVAIPEPPQPPQPAAIRSIFPRYNPEIPLDRQDYYPTQASPTHIPQSAISRPMYSARDADQQSEAGTNAGTNGPTNPRNRPVANPSVTSGSANQRWPVTRSHEPPVIPTVNTTEELRGLWKAANGWRATQLEGRKYCLKMASDAYAPVYTLSSSSNQPFYCLRVDPTSASALVSLSRYDPNKTFKGDKSTSAAVGISAASAVASSASSTSSTSSSPIPDARASSSTPSPRPSSVFSRNPDGSGGALGGASSKSTKTKKHDAKHWQEVISTTLEAAVRKQPPNDGLVAQLWPLKAARLASDRATTDAATVAAAENECGRLVWDSDSGNHYLVHPSLAMPFCITVERNAAYSRTEYTLEHIESPNHLGRLTRDGTGQGWLEIDTAIASHVEAVYLIDVAIAALVLVAHADEQFIRVETFEPPPAVFGGPPGAAGAGGGGSQRSSLAESLSSALRRNTTSDGGEKEDKKKRKKQKEKDLVNGIKTRVEQFELDIEAQVNADLKAKNEKMPGCTRGLIAVLKFAFKAIIWCATLVFKVFMLFIKGCEKGPRWN